MSTIKSYGKGEREKGREGDKTHSLSPSPPLPLSLSTDGAHALNKKDLRLVITDIDGVWTDGSMYYDERGNELKRFNTSDSAGVLFCRLNDIDVAILTGEQTEIVARRAKKLNVRHLYQGIQNKKATAQRLLDTLGLTFAQTAFIGDDINDIPLLQAVGYAGTVPSAPDYVKRYATYVTHRDGGAGAFRDFVEHLLRQRGLLEQTIDKYLAQIPSTVGTGERVSP